MFEIPDEIIDEVDYPPTDSGTSPVEGQYE